MTTRTKLLNGTRDVMGASDMPTVNDNMKGMMMLDNGDGTVTDPRTGLMWEQVGPTKPYAHAAAIQYCTDLRLAGHTDWRLPTRAELLSLVDGKRKQPAIDPIITCQSNFYWSATTYQHRPSLAWNVSFFDGNVFANTKYSNSYVRGVRGGSFAIRPFDTLVDENAQLRAEVERLRAILKALA